MHQVRFPFVHPFFLTQSTSCSDVRRRHGGVTAAIAVDVVAVRICTSVRPSVHGVWHYIKTNVGQQNHLNLAPKNLGFGSPRFWQKTAVFGFSSVTVTALVVTNTSTNQARRSLTMLMRQTDHCHHHSDKPAARDAGNLNNFPKTIHLNLIANTKHITNTVNTVLLQDSVGWW